MEMAECGSASLGMMLGYFGRRVPLADLRRDCGVSRDGSKASNILAAARRYGLIAKGFKKDLKALESLPYPYIVFWNFNHFLVVEGFRRGKVFINDPATGPRSVSIDEFDDAFTGVVLVMEPGPEFEKGGSEPSVMLGLWRRLRHSLLPLAACGFAAFLLVLPGLAIPAMSEIFVDKVLIQNLHDWARPLVLGLLLTAVLRALLAGIQLRLLRLLKIKLAVVMSSNFVWHLLKLPAAYYAQRFGGEVAGRIALNDRVADVLSGRLATTSVDLLMLVFYGFVMFQFDHVLTAIALGFVALNFLLLRWVSRRRKDGNQKLILEFGKLGGVAISGLQGIRTIKASALESEFFSRWAGHYAKATNAQQELSLTTQYFGLLPRFVSSVMALLILTVGGLRVMDGALTIGMLVAFQSLTSSFLEPVRNLLDLGGSLQQLAGDIGRLDDVLNNPTVPEASSEPLAGTVDKLKGYVEFRNVTFGYNPTSPPLIENLSFSVRPGQRLALVGGSGSGKSTVAKLLCGLYEPHSGEILLDGVNRAQVHRSALSSSLSAVDQEIMLFGGTVHDNLTLWDPTVPANSLTAACDDAVIHDAIAAMPQGYHNPLLEGAANMSGGQRQRLEIARALVSRPSILVLDEATAALDAETEVLLDRNIRMRGCTCIIVAHRLSTIRDCDEILVLDEGKVVQRGTHEEMIGKPGPYRALISTDGEALSEETYSGA
jgi:NHLM bacteriocin system ABC transporter peptidase/ATP-binding protein